MRVSKGTFFKRFVMLLAVGLIVMCMTMPALASSGDDANAGTEVSEQAQDEGSSSASRALAAAGCVGVVALAGTFGMSLAVSRAEESIARQPEAASDIRGSMMLGLVFMETAIIYALIVAILIIFVL